MIGLKTNADGDTLNNLYAKYGNSIVIFSGQVESKIWFRNRELLTNVRNELLQAGWIVIIL